MKFKSIFLWSAFAFFSIYSHAQKAKQTVTENYIEELNLRLDTAIFTSDKNTFEYQKEKYLFFKSISNQDIFICVAAVADYSPANPSTHKIKKSDQENNIKPLTLELKRNKDILAEVASLPNAPFSVGFAAETVIVGQLLHLPRRRIH